MQFLRSLFWAMVTAVAIIFAYRNWTPVTVRLWGGLIADAKLPVLLLGAFLLGLVPTYILHRASRWRLRRRAESAERSLAELNGAAAASPAAPSGGSEEFLPEPRVLPVPPAIS